MRIGLDLDGVVYKWSDTVRYLIRSYFGLNIGESTSWNYIQEHVPEEVWNWLWAEGVELGMFRHGHLYRGAIEGVQALSGLGDVVVITHRPKAAIRDTLAFLSYHFGGMDPYPFAEVHLLTKQEPKSGIPCDIYIDDSPTNVSELLTNRPESDVVVFSQPWNQILSAPEGDPDELYVERATGWDEVPGIVSSLIGKDF